MVLRDNKKNLILDKHTKTKITEQKNLSKFIMFNCEYFKMLIVSVSWQVNVLPVPPHITFTVLAPLQQRAVKHIMLDVAT